MSVDKVMFKLAESVSRESVVVSSSPSSESNGYSDDPVTPMYSDESSVSSLLVGSKVVSLIFSVDDSSSSATISFVMLSDSVVSVINGVDEYVLVSVVVSSIACVVSLTSLGVTLCTNIQVSSVNF